LPRNTNKALLPGLNSGQGGNGKNNEKDNRLNKPANRAIMIMQTVVMMMEQNKKHGATQKEGRYSQ